MPRKMKAPTRRKAREETLQPVGPDDFVIRSAASKIKSAKQAAQAAAGAHQAQRKNAKALGISLDPLSQALKLSDMTTDDARAWARSFANCLRALGVFQDHTADFESGDDPLHNTPVEDSVHTAKRRGMEDGVGNAPYDNPYPDESENGIAYKQGWQAGQKKIAAEMAPAEPEPATA